MGCWPLQSKEEGDGYHARSGIGKGEQGLALVEPMIFRSGGWLGFGFYRLVSGLKKGLKTSP